MTERPSGWYTHPSGRTKSLPRDWKKRRRAVLIRDGWRCQINGARCIGLASDVDHVGDRDDHSLANLRAACGPCHRQRTSSQGGKAAAAKRPSRKRPEERHPSLRDNGE